VVGLPIFIGQAIALQQQRADANSNNAPLWQTVAFVHAMGVMMQAVVLYLNDYADQHTDAINSTYFLSGGSRVLVNRLLEPHHLLLGCGTLTAAALLLLNTAASVLQWQAQQTWTVLSVAALCCSTGYLYSMPPFRLSFRGYGELCQAIALGVCLPIFGFTMHGGALSDYPWSTPLVLCPVFYAANANTGLPDVPSDRISGRLTLAVRSGETATRVTVALLPALAFTLGTLIAGPPLHRWVHGALMAASVAAAVWLLDNRELITRSDVSQNARLCRRFVLRNAVYEAAVTFLYGLAIVLR
jgi:1,4-dihydroxy-2-naphthoate octaprenyltransferase